mmetsp:Transcript_54234/g.144882  ORF Transcript_54234/g.144882 Transcript_54234/m.144882 type:complete len:222 (-) Transcript_54234:171-836(-)
MCRSWPACRISNRAPSANLCTVVLEDDRASRTRGAKSSSTPTSKRLTSCAAARPALAATCSTPQAQSSETRSRSVGRSTLSCLLAAPPVSMAARQARSADFRTSPTSSACATRTAVTRSVRITAALGRCWISWYDTSHAVTRTLASGVRSDLLRLPTIKASVPSLVAATAASKPRRAVARSFSSGSARATSSTGSIVATTSLPPGTAAKTFGKKKHTTRRP